ncbi:MAG TPA: hypothetical protein VGR01_00740 [Burkholderiales bacterium]|nr:hypothetical protein [Burkholderiales bacterium]
MLLWIAIDLRLGYVKGVIQDNFRHGMTTLSAALDLAQGEVIGQRKARHCHQEFMSFLNHPNRHISADLDAHLIPDN